MAIGHDQFWGQHHARAHMRVAIGHDRLNAHNVARHLNISCRIGLGLGLRRPGHPKCNANQSDAPPHRVPLNSGIILCL